MAVRKQSLPEPEELFLDYVKRMARHRDGREVLLAHMSELEPVNKTRHHVELVTTRLGQIARKYDGRVFRFLNGDIACVLREASPGAIDDVLFDIRYGFSTDLLVQAEDAGEAVFIERLDVRWNYEAVETLAKDRLASFQSALSTSMTAAEDELAVEARIHPERGAQDPAPSEEGGKTPPGKSAFRKIASLLEMDRGKRGPGPKRDPEPKQQVIAGPLDQWLAENKVRAAGIEIPLSEVVRTLPIYEIGRAGQPAASATVQVSQGDLIEAHTRASGMKMSERLESFLHEEVETGLVPLLGSLVLPGNSPGASARSGFRRSVCLSPQIILGPTFLLAARAWQEAEDSGTIFWFVPDDLEQDLRTMSYIADFLHDMGHLVGLRGLVPGDLVGCSAQMPQIDGWALKWPEQDVSRAPQGEVDSLARAIGEWGAEHCLLQGINSEVKAGAAKSFGYRYAECIDVASVKFFSRPS